MRNQLARKPDSPTTPRHRHGSAEVEMVMARRTSPSCCRHRLGWSRARRSTRRTRSRPWSPPPWVLITPFGAKEQAAPLLTLPSADAHLHGSNNQTPGEKGIRRPQSLFSSPSVASLPAPLWRHPPASWPAFQNSIVTKNSDLRDLIEFHKIR
jgi:hypothetical protein